MRFKILIFKISSIFISFSFIFCLSELLCRYKHLGFDGYTLKQEIFRIKNFNDHVKNNWFQPKWPVKLDSNLGWKLKPGSHTHNNPWNKKVIIDKDGFRSNGDIRKLNKNDKIILFAGDSFTFGDGVNDNETFPALYQTLIREKVVNAGVSGYGIDQIYLRTKQLLNDYNISEIFFCFIANDIIRSEHSIWTGAKKPYFNFNENKLEYFGINKDIKTYSEINIFQKYGGYSFFIHTVMVNFAMEYWLKPSSIGTQSKHNNGIQVSRLLFTRLKNLCDKKNIKLHLVPLMDGWEMDEYKDENLLKNLLVGFDNKFSVIDLYSELKQIKDENLTLWKSFFIYEDGHFSKDGNNFVSNYIFQNNIIYR